MRIEPMEASLSCCGSRHGRSPMPGRIGGYSSVSRASYGTLLDAWEGAYSPSLSPTPKTPAPSRLISHAAATYNPRAPPKGAPHPWRSGRRAHLSHRHEGVEANS